MLPNLFNTATSVIPPETIEYVAFVSEQVNDIGISVPTYADAVNIKASVQPLGDDFYKGLGLEFQKEYYYVYSNQRMHGLNENSHPDKLKFHGKTFIVHKNCYWNEYNGWGYVLAVKDDV